MGVIRFAWVLPMLVIGCGGETPPLDELPLRDALRADPAVVASLDDVARQRLAARFEAARTGDGAADEVAVAATVATEVTALDEARARRSADALVVGLVADGVGRPVAAGAGAGEPDALPPLEGEVATSTGALEARALAGSAGVLLRGLFATSGARRLERVVGWPAGAIAIGETIYVDAAWLVALAPAEAGADGGAIASSAPAGAAAASTSAGGPSDASTAGIAESSPSAGVDVSAASPDAGTVFVPPSPNPPPTTDGPSFWDACSASSDSCDTSDGSDACSSGGDYDDGSSCSGGGDDGSGDGCSAPPDDGAGCRTAPGRGHPRDAAIVWLLAPLGFLLGKRR